MAGHLLVGMGLPGAGKSSVLGALADRLLRRGVATTIYREPEEPAWPPAVSDRNRSGFITALTWFRAARVPMLYSAQQDRADGKIAIVDSYYDKLIHLYFAAPGFEWLMPPDDPYRKVYEQLIALDYDRLPNADCVITFTVSEDRWRELVRGRGRDLDRSSNLLSLHITHQSFLAAADAYCARAGAHHVIFENIQPTLASAAEALEVELVRRGLLS